MEYKLSKELQDAGWVYKDGSCSVGPTATPTLEELIEAIGANLYSLHRELIPGHFDPVWIAHATAGLKSVHPDAETALARLWLALNKK